MKKGKTNIFLLESEQIMNLGIFMCLRGNIKLVADYNNKVVLRGGCKLFIANGDKKDRNSTKK